MTNGCDKAKMAPEPGHRAVNPGLMPPPLTVEELRHYPTPAEVMKGHRWHTIAVDAVTIENAREGMVTIGITGYFGADDAHLYEIDLAPGAAEELALRLVLRARDVRREASADDAEFEDE